MLSPIVDPVKIATGIFNYPKYYVDLYNYFKKEGNRKFHFIDLYPILNENTPYTNFDYHYFYQQLWVFENVLRNKPIKHVDVGSTYQMSGYLSTIVPVDFVDIRPIKTNKDNLNVVNASILKLPYESNSVESISSLHVLEHIGLGRYGDPIDPQGIGKAAAELSRVLKPGGYLYVSTPIGKERVCFNAHRVSDPLIFKDMFKGLKLLSFDLLDDDNKYTKDANIENGKPNYYALGMYKFTK